MAASKNDEGIFIIIFLVLLFIFISMVSKPYQKAEAMKVLEAISADNENANENVAFIYRDKIDEIKLTSMSKLQYDQIKKELGVKNEFYMYLEDSNGKLVPIDGKACIGSSKATVNGEQCS